jgi:PleD family two-component response regulator
LSNDEIINIADKALYTSKTSGKNKTFLLTADAIKSSDK